MTDYHIDEDTTRSSILVLDVGDTLYVAPDVTFACTGGPVFGCSGSNTADIFGDLVASADSIVFGEGGNGGNNIHLEAGSSVIATGNSFRTVFIGGGDNTLIVDGTVSGPDTAISNHIDGEDDVGGNTITIGETGSVSAGTIPLQIGGGNNQIVVNGEINGGGYGMSLSLTGNSITIGATGSVSGNNAIIAFGSTVENDGVISGRIGIGHGVSGGSGYMTILNAGEISTVDGFGIALLSGANSVTNSGRITSEGAAAIVVEQTSSSEPANDIGNSGKIISKGDAAIITGDATATITNTGRIVGDIEFGVGNDSYFGGHGKLRGIVFGGDGDDFLTGSGTSFSGGNGSDTITCLNGKSLIICDVVTDSGGSDYDTVLKLDAGTDRFDLSVNVAGIDPTIQSGQLRSGSFTSDLSAAVTPANLAAGNAVIFNASSGDFKHHTFLIVDANGVAGYQADADFVFDITGAEHVHQLSTATFI